MKKSVFFSQKGRVLATTLTFVLVTVLQTYASGTVSSALSGADTEIRASFAPVSKIMLAVMAIVAVVGAIAVYGKWSNGDPDTRKSAASWFGALIFAGLVLLVIKAVFGVA